MKAISFVLAFVLMVLVLASAASTGEKDKTADKIARAKKVLGDAKIDFAAALALAQKKIPDGKALVGRVEVSKKGQSRYGFYFLDGAKVQEVELDVKTGEIVKFEEKKDFMNVKKLADAKQVLDSGAKVTFAQAIEIGSARVKEGKLFELELEMVENRGVVELEFLVDGKIAKVQIDAKDPTAVKLK